MVPSPRKRAPPAAFDQSWEAADAAFLDPQSLPVARIPRAWERKQETKRIEGGKEKTVWRRFNLRSRASEPAVKVEEEHDARSRPIKKLQRMSPKAMEKTALKARGRVRTFEPTRWDRRKSVLPRKKAATLEEVATSAQETDSDLTDSPDASAIEPLNDSFERSQDDVAEATPGSMTLLPAVDSRRGTFTFSARLEKPEESYDHDGTDEQTTQDTLIEASVENENTLIKICISPPKRLPGAQTYSAIPFVCRPLAMVDGDANDEDIVDGMNCLDDEVEDSDAPASPENNGALPTTIEIERSPANESAIDRHSGVQQSPFNEQLYPALPDTTPSPKNDAHFCGLTLKHQAAPAGTEELPIEDSVAYQSTLLVSEKEDCASPAMDQECPEFSNEGEELTESSLQLDLLEDYKKSSMETEHEMAGDSTGVEEVFKDESSGKRNQSFDLESMQNGTTDDPADVAAFPDTTMHPILDTASVNDITDGLTLTLTPRKPTLSQRDPQKLHSPPPPPPCIESSVDDVTMTIAIDDDTALLKDFLNRAAASKAEKAASITRRESLQNRRDSDVVRHALASPRKVLEDKDPNSPTKYDADLTMELTENLTLTMDQAGLALPSADQTNDDMLEDPSARGSRRSSRTKKSRLPGPASAVQTQASKIAIRRADGTEYVVLKKSDVQELANLTRANTRKNKQGAFSVAVRLLKLASEAANLPLVDDGTKELVLGRNIRWDSQLTYYQEHPDTMAEAESLATPDELSMPEGAASPNKKSRSKTPKNSTTKVRRVRGLGTANGTPGKSLLTPASLLPEAVQAEQEESEFVTPSAALPTEQTPQPKSSRLKKMQVASSSTLPVQTSLTVPTKSASKLPTLDITPVGLEQTTQRRSRLAAPKKVTLPQSTMIEGKENTQRLGLSGATPKKGIPAPKVIAHPIASAGVESGLPRRRGRRT